jgi:hypothetical protein
MSKFYRGALRCPIDTHRDSHEVEVADAAGKPITTMQVSKDRQQRASPSASHRDARGRGADRVRDIDDNDPVIGPNIQYADSSDLPTDSAS